MFFKDIDDCIDHGCVNGQCKVGINSYTCDCNGTGFEGKQCENGEVKITCFNYICSNIIFIGLSDIQMPG